MMMMRMEGREEEAVPKRKSSPTTPQSGGSSRSGAERATTPNRKAVHVSKEASSTDIKCKPRVGLHIELQVKQGLGSGWQRGEIVAKDPIDVGMWEVQMETIKRRERLEGHGRVEWRAVELIEEID